MLQAIIVDDERLSLKRLSRILAETGEVEVCGAFQNPLEAYDYVQEHAVDLAFLDVSMPEVNGLALSRRLQEVNEAIDIVFVTGYEEYALQAFDTSAMDYLLKPVSAERVERTLRKIRRHHPRRENVGEMVEAVKAGGSEAAGEKPLLEARLLGGLTLAAGGRERALLKLRSPKTEELLAFLLTRRSVTREEVEETLWSGFDAEKAGNNLNSHLHYIRRALNEHGVAGCLRADRREVRVDESGIFCDLYAFQRMYQEIRSEAAGGGEGVGEKLRQALQLYTGPFLAGKAYDWAGPYADGLEQAYVELLERTARFNGERQQHEQALRAYQAILQVDPLREDAARQAIRLLIGLGRQSEALRVYRSLEDQLLRELGTRPAPLLQELVKGLRG